MVWSKKVRYPLAVVSRLQRGTPVSQKRFGQKEAQHPLVVVYRLQWLRDPPQLEMVWSKKGAVPLVVVSRLQWLSPPDSQYILGQKEVQYLIAAVSRLPWLRDPRQSEKVWSKRSTLPFLNRVSYVMAEGPASVRNVSDKKRYQYPCRKSKHASANAAKERYCSSVCSKRAPPPSSHSKLPSTRKKVRTGCRSPPASLSILSLGCSSPYMLLAERTPHGASRFEQGVCAWSVKPDVLRPGIIDIRRSMLIRLRPCVA